MSCHFFFLPLYFPSLIDNPLSCPSFLHRDCYILSFQSFIPHQHFHRSFPLLSISPSLHHIHSSLHHSFTFIFSHPSLSPHSILFSFIPLTIPLFSSSSSFHHSFPHSVIPVIISINVSSLSPFPSSCPHSVMPYIIPSFLPSSSHLLHFVTLSLPQAAADAKEQRPRG